MITLDNQRLQFSFPDLHEKASTSIEFQRTLRVPDDGKDYPLPAGLGKLPLLHTEDFKGSFPEKVTQTGGVILPMYQSEAMWMSFSNRWGYPCAIKIATGKICAITGEEWTNSLSDENQDYIVTDEQPWLDGYRIDKNTVRQFVAMPLAEGYSVEEQLTGKAEWGGLQIMVVPMKRAFFDKPRRYINPMIVCYKSMGLAPGGKIRQEIYADPHGVDAWDLKHASRCFVQIANSNEFKKVTGLNPPTTPMTPTQYKNEGIPWFSYYNESEVASGESRVTNTQSVAQKHLNKHWDVLEGNQPIEFERVEKISKRL